jgi:diguanylate cyclase (GGDEF)-like protein
VAADIIARVPFPSAVAPLILRHHERWDGNGYPDGLKGEQIPLGARVLSAVDYFDVLRTNRPHRAAMTAGAALGMLVQESGKALDPRVVRAFLDVYPAVAAELDAMEQSPSHRPADRPAQPTLDTAKSRVTTPSGYDEVAKTNRELVALYEVSQAIGSSIGVSDTMAILADKIGSVVPFSCCALFLYNDDGDMLRCRFAAGVEAETIQQLTMPNGEGLAGWVARNHRSLVNAGPSLDVEAAGHPADQIALKSALVVPLVFNKRMIGTLSVYHVREDAYTDDHRRLLERVCEQLAAVIYNSIGFEQLQEDALTDALTGLPNMRFMFMHLVRELARGARLRSELTVIVATLDTLKDIHDKFGHLARDRALREVAAVLRASIRPYDIATRYEGDEFIVVLSGCGPEEAERRRVELQRLVEAVQFEADDSTTLQLTFSTGAAVFPHDGETYEQLMEVATRRRHSGRIIRYTRGAVH